MKTPRTMPPTEGDSRAAEDPRPASAVPAADARRFRDLLTSGESPQDGRAKAAGDQSSRLPCESDGDGDSNPPPPPGERMLSFLQGASESDASPLPSRAGKLGELGRHLAERILVSAPRLDASPQVHIHLKEGVLSRTEIVLERRESGLEVRFHTGDPVAFQTLQTHIAGLQQSLEARLDTPGPVRITVERSPSGEDMPRDGRSRNRRQYQDEDD